MPVEFNPLLPEHQRDPHPLYHALRAEDPVHWSPLFQGWVLTRHADVSAVLRDPRFGVERGETDLIRGAPMPEVRPELREVADALKRTLLFVDPPAHTRLRGLVNKAFTPHMVDAYAPRIQAIVDARLDAVAAAGRMDLMRDLANPVPVTVIAEVLGVPAADQGEFLRWSEDIGEPLDPFVTPEAFERAQASAIEMYRYFQGVFAERRRRPRGDLVSALVAAEEQGRVLSESELFAMCALLLGAGHRTTTNFLGNTVSALLRHPGERRRLADAPGLLPTALAESLRWESPVQVTARIARERAALGGKTIGAGDFVILLLGAANRDPAEFRDPDRLDVGRRENRHLAFSAGIHTCLGSRLALLEGEIVLTTLFRRFPDLALEDEAPDWKPAVIARGLATLGLRFAPARAAAGSAARP